MCSARFPFRRRPSPYVSNVRRARVDIILYGVATAVIMNYDGIKMSNERCALARRIVRMSVHNTRESRADGNKDREKKKNEIGGGERRRGKFVTVEIAPIIILARGTWGERNNNMIITPMRRWDYVGIAVRREEHVTKTRPSTICMQNRGGCTRTCIV